MKAKNTLYTAGFDVGSTTAKIAVFDASNQLVFSDYQRHNTKIYQTAIQMLQSAEKQLGNIDIALKITGSAGIGMAEKTGLPFIQEVVAATTVVKQLYPDISTLIDIGGEDSKMIFFHAGRPPDIRMNGNCAGGTGAFIDQMATLLNVSLSEFNELAGQYQEIYPVASRCGVFAKTDVQNLLSRKISKADIAASVFHAVAIQLLNTLARGFDIRPAVMLCGGPFTFLPELSTIFIRDLKLRPEEVVMPEHPELLPAMGAALDNASRYVLPLPQMIELLQNSRKKQGYPKNRLQPLFKSRTELQEWNQRRISKRVERTALHEYTVSDAFLGIDSGSTTTKIALIGKNAELLFHFYANNYGNPIESVQRGLQELHEKIVESKQKIRIRYTAVTGYGEDLIRAALSIDAGIVETIAHFTAARHFNKNVSFIMDIGGQDMKAIFVRNGIIHRIELNESCSSGCGSFIQTFGHSLGYEIQDFAEIACHAKAPADLGSRCTVFMNSKVKQSLRENAEIEDIAAGLSVSVIKNALFKVLKLKKLDELGEHIVVQGGTFRNPSVHRALEQLTGKTVICSDIPEMMGAYGAALFAAKTFLNKAKDSKSNKLAFPETAFRGFEHLNKTDTFESRQLVCKGCENLCHITRFDFDNGNRFYSGNKCEKVFSNKGESSRKSYNFFNFKYDLLFNRPLAHHGEPLKGLQSIGIPRVLNMYVNYPFWNTLFRHCGIDVVLSAPSTVQLYETGSGSVMSDSICFPAKLVHGHIVDLVEKKVDRIFYPMVVFEHNDMPTSENSFNCPIVSSYPEVVRSAMNPAERYGVPFDQPVVTLDNVKLLKKAMRNYLKQFGLTAKRINEAVDRALNEQAAYHRKLQQKAAEIIAQAERTKQLLVVLAGRPYHLDPLINQKTPQILTDLGADIISEDVVPLVSDSLKKLQVISQWLYPNKIYNAAEWVSLQPTNIQFVQLNSFGCGPDAIAVDEAIEILQTTGKNHALIRVDEITSTGSIRLRLRSLLESLRLKKNNKPAAKKERITTAAFEEKDKTRRTILAPLFSDIYSRFLPPLFDLAGYRLENLPAPDKASVNYGLKYSNNEICYPATVIVGDIIKTLESGKYNHEEIAIGITQTGGQCRASSYMALIKKALIVAGYEDIPVISVNAGNEEMNLQPGFRIEWKKLIKITYITTLFADGLSKMYHATVVREKNRGETKQLLDYYIDASYSIIKQRNSKALLQLLRQAVDAFNAIPVHSGHYPKIGVVGEIYVKYNSFGNHNTVEWLIEQGIEVVVPPLLDFFLQAFVNTSANRKHHLAKPQFSDAAVFLFEKLANVYFHQMVAILKKFRYFTPFHHVRAIAQKAERILSLANQFGEGWLIPAEIAAFADEGIYNVVSLQPFGCIANHVISKGVEKRIRDLYPQMNLLFLDFDDGTSHVNIINRLHFMVKNVREQTIEQNVTI